MSRTPLDSLFTVDFESQLQELMRSTHTPGCESSLVRKNEDETWEEVIKVYGDANDNQPVTPDTRFPIASNTKLFTVFALAELLEKHGLTFETRVKDILPEFELVDKVTENLCTIADFCCHMTGIPGYDLVYVKGQTGEDLLDLFRGHLPSTTFRETLGFQYNNQTYGILGLVIEKLAGIPYAEYIQQAFFGPLDMQTAGFDWDGVTAAGHWTRRSGDTVEILGTATSVPACQSSGGIIASARDMVEWLKAVAPHTGYEQASIPRAIDHGWGEVWNFPYSSSVTTYGAGFFQLGMSIMVNGYQGEDVINLLRMTVLDRITNGAEHGTEEWLRRIAEETDIKDARQTTGMSSFRAKGSSPLIGIYTCPSLFTFHLDKSNNVDLLPECEVLPYLPQLYGELRPLVAYAGDGKYRGCMEWTYKSKQYFGVPFRAELIDIDDSQQIKVFGLSGHGSRIDPDSCPAIYNRIRD
ncbi:hypothetical protein IAT40_002148 [Kwoniella sp. CBS 6097]